MGEAHALATLLGGFWVFLVLAGIAYLFVPFAIFGTKDILRQILAELRTNNRLLQEAAEREGAPTQPLADSSGP